MREEIESDFVDLVESGFDNLPVEQAPPTIASLGRRQRNLARLMPDNVQSGAFEIVDQLREIGCHNILDDVTNAINKRHVSSMERVDMIRATIRANAF